MRQSEPDKTPLVLVVKLSCDSFSPITYLYLRMFEMASMLALFPVLAARRSQRYHIPSNIPIKIKLILFQRPSLTLTLKSWGAICHLMYHLRVLYSLLRSTSGILRHSNTRELQTTPWSGKADSEKLQCCERIQESRTRAEPGKASMCELAVESASSRVWIPVKLPILILPWLSQLLGSHHLSEPILTCR